MITSQPALSVVHNGSGRFVLSVILTPHYPIYSLLAGTFTTPDNLVITWHQHWHHTDIIVTPYWHHTMTLSTSGPWLLVIKMKYIILHRAEHYGYSYSWLQYYWGVITMISGVVSDDKSIETYLYSDGGGSKNSRIIRERGANTSKNRFPLYLSLGWTCCTFQLKCLNPA